MKRFVSLILCAAALVSFFAFHSFAYSADEYINDVGFFPAYVTVYSSDSNVMSSPVRYVSASMITNGKWSGTFHYFVEGDVKLYLDLRIPSSGSVSIAGWTPVNSKDIVSGYNDVTYVYEGFNSAFSLWLDCSISGASYFQILNAYVKPQFSYTREIRPTATNFQLNIRNFDGATATQILPIGSSFLTGGVLTNDITTTENVYYYYTLTFTINKYYNDVASDFVGFTVINNCNYSIRANFPFKQIGDQIIVDFRDMASDHVNFTINYYPEDDYFVDNYNNWMRHYDPVLYGLSDLYMSYPSATEFSISAIGSMLLDRLKGIYNKIGVASTDIINQIAVAYTAITSQLDVVSHAITDKIEVGYHAITDKIDIGYHAITDWLSVIYYNFLGRLEALINGTSSQQSAVDDFGSSAESQSSEASNAVSGLESVPTLDPADLDLDPDIPLEGTNVLRAVITPILSNSIIFQIIFMSLIFALGSYIVFGKR